MPIKPKLTARNEMKGFSLFIELTNSDGDIANVAWTLKLPPELLALSEGQTTSKETETVHPYERLQTASLSFNLSAMSDLKRDALLDKHIEFDGTVVQDGGSYGIPASKLIRNLISEGTF